MNGTVQSLVQNCFGVVTMKPIEARRNDPANQMPRPPSYENRSDFGVVIPHREEDPAW